MLNTDCLFSHNVFSVFFRGFHHLSLASSCWLFMTPLLALCLSEFYDSAVSLLVSSFSGDSSHLIPLSYFWGKCRLSQGTLF